MRALVHHLPAYPQGLGRQDGDRGVAVTHTTIVRSVLYVPESEKRWARFARPVESSWRMDARAVDLRHPR